MMISAWQSTSAIRRLPACGLLLALLLAPSLAAQQRRVSASAAHKAPGGAVLATIPAPLDMTTGPADGQWTRVTLDGWITSRALRAQKRDGFDFAVTAPAGENLRVAPNGRVVARVRYGALLQRVETRGVWEHVRREVWVPRAALDAPVKVATRTATAPPAYRAMGGQQPDTVPPARAIDPSQVDRVELARGSALFLTPEGGQLGTLETGTAARIVGRSGEWVRVQTEGWIRAADVQPAAGASQAGVSAAEVRANPSRYVGQTLDWRLQLVAIQTADELRPEIPAGQSYLLTRGPLPEPGFVYVMIPRDQVDRFRGMGPLTELTLRVRIRAARTKYLPTPVAELVAVIEPADARR